MNLEMLIAEFAAATGIENPAPVEGVWKFSADDHVFGIVADDSDSNLWIYGEIPAPLPEREDAFRQAVLEANFFMRGTGGAVFSVNPETGAYTLMKSMPLAAATPDEFFSLVEKFVNTLATWKGISGATCDAPPAEALQQPRAVSGKTDPEEPGREEDDAMPIFPGMMRV